MPDVMGYLILASTLRSQVSFGSFSIFNKLENRDTLSVEDHRVTSLQADKR